jgi:hypothetical protein
LFGFHFYCKQVLNSHLTQVIVSRGCNLSIFRHPRGSKLLCSSKRNVLHFSRYLLVSHWYTISIRYLSPGFRVLMIGYGQWTLWGVCGATTDGKNVNCGKHHPGYPFSPADNFGSAHVPAYFVNHEDFFFFTSRFMFAFFLIAITFAVVSLFTGLLALCSRLGSAVSSVFALVPPSPSSGS